MIKHDVVQGSTRWLELRAGIPTASELNCLLTPKFATKTGETPKNYLAFKVAESWVGGPLPSFTSAQTEQGTLREPKAIDWYNFEHKTTVQRIGFITTDDGSAGCSPDGLIGDDCGIEIKCPEPSQHVKYVLAGKLPDDYAVQVHASMFVTGFRSWKFLSYCRGFPPLLLTIPRDERIQEVIDATLEAFSCAFEQSMADLLKANGGIQPKKRQPYKEADWITCPVEQLKPHDRTPPND